MASPGWYEKKKLNMKTFFLLTVPGYTKLVAEV